MRLLRLQLTDFRNFSRLDLALGPGPSVFVGDNAQGKTNLLEAVYLLATMRARRAAAEADLIRREGAGEPMPLARVVGQVETRQGALKVEVGIIGRPGPGGLLASKVARVNGIPRRLSDALGQMTAVLFTAEDMEILTGPPALRRRYLDVTLTQVDRPYLAARQRFERVLLQRNHLLKRIREGLARPDELSFWDEELARDGGHIFYARAAALGELGRLAGDAHAPLAPGEELRIAYRPRLEVPPEALAEGGPQGAAHAYGEALRRGLQRDIAAGMTLLGPHRDDVDFSLGGAPAAGYASRAQQRTIALAFRLAEARFLYLRRGEPPVLLLDDVLSEMDTGRRRSVVEAIADYDQFLVTAAELDRFPAAFLSRAAVYSVVAGTVEPLGRGAAAPSGRTGES